jgi:hypothetical protein
LTACSWGSSFDVFVGISGPAQHNEAGTVNVSRWKPSTGAVFLAIGAGLAAQHDSGSNADVQMSFPGQAALARDSAAESSRSCAGAHLHHPS